MSAQNTEVFGEEFKIDTSKFADIISNAEQLVDKMTSLKNTLDNAKRDLMFTWAGLGRNTFEKKYNLLSQQFGDLKEDLREIAEELKKMEQEYIQADMDLAKSLDGIDKIK